MLARTAEVALSVHSGRSYPHGLEFTFALHTRAPRRRQGDPMSGWHGRPGGEIGNGGWAGYAPGR